MILYLVMQSPFLFGKTVGADGFTNRTKDIQRLKANFTNQVNTIIISPRRWGKSSLVKKVVAGINSRQTKVVMLDMMGIRNEEGFYKAFAAATIRATSNKVEEWIATGKQFLKNVTPKISIGSDPMQELDISFEWKSVEKNYQEILNLPEKIGLSKNIQIIVCLDEFQNLAGFDASCFDGVYVTGDITDADIARLGASRQGGTAEGMDDNSRLALPNHED